MRNLILALALVKVNFASWAQCPTSFTCTSQQLTCANTTSQIQLTTAASSVTCVWNGLGIVSGDSTLAPVIYLPGVYSFTLTDLSNGCITQSLTTVSQNTTMPTMSITTSSLVLTCTNSSVNLYCSTTPSNVVVWNGGVLANAPNPATTNFAGSYTATTTDPVSGCYSTSVVTVISNISTTQPTVNVNSATICSGNTGITINATGANTYTWVPVIGLNSSTGSSVIASPASTTIYTVTGSVGSCTANATTTVVVNPTPSVSFSLTPNASTLHVWDVTPTYSGGTPPYSYQWNWGDGSPNATIAYPSHTYTTAGWYNICTTLTDANGCISTSCKNDSLYRMNSSNAMVTVNVTNGLTTGFNQNININSVSIYPNPNNGIVNLQVTDAMKGDVDITVYDVTGKQVFKNTLSVVNALTHFELDVKSGVYFVKISNKEKSIIKRLIVSQ